MATDYRMNGITLDYLDSLALTIVKSSTTTWGKAWAAILLLATAAYIYARVKVADAQMQIASQQMEQELKKKLEQENEVTE
jgi:hypothetical protein